MKHERHRREEEARRGEPSRHDPSEREESARVKQQANRDNMVISIVSEFNVARDDFRTKNDIDKDSRTWSDSEIDQYASELESRLVSVPGDIMESVKAMLLGFGRGHESVLEEVKEVVAEVIAEAAGLDVAEKREVSELIADLKLHFRRVEIHFLETSNRLEELGSTPMTIEFIKECHARLIFQRGAFKNISQSLESLRDSGDSTEGSFEEIIAETSGQLDKISDVLFDIDRGIGELFEERKVRHHRRNLVEADNRALMGQRKQKKRILDEMLKELDELIPMVEAEMENHGSDYHQVAVHREIERVLKEIEKKDEEVIELEKQLREKYHRSGPSSNSSSHVEKLAHPGMTRAEYDEFFRQFAQNLKHIFEQYAPPDSHVVERAKLVMRTFARQSLREAIEDDTLFDKYIKVNLDNYAIPLVSEMIEKIIGPLSSAVNTAMRHLIPPLPQSVHASSEIDEQDEGELAPDERDVYANSEKSFDADEYDDERPGRESGSITDVDGEKEASEESGPQSDSESGEGGRSVVSSSSDEEVDDEPEDEDKHVAAGRKKFPNADPKFWAVMALLEGNIVSSELLCRNYSSIIVQLGVFYSGGGLPRKVRNYADNLRKVTVMCRELDESFRSDSRRMSSVTTEFDLKNSTRRLIIALDHVISSVKGEVYYLDNVKRNHAMVIDEKRYNELREHLVTTSEQGGTIRSKIVKLEDEARSGMYGPGLLTSFMGMQLGTLPEAETDHQCFFTEIRKYAIERMKNLEYSLEELQASEQIQFFFQDVLDALVDKRHEVESLMSHHDRESEIYRRSHHQLEGYRGRARKVVGFYFEVFGSNLVSRREGPSHEIVTSTPLLCDLKINEDRADQLRDAPDLYKAWLSVS